MTTFVPYITYKDYLPTIQSQQLNDQILDELQLGIGERQFAESWAIGRVFSHLDGRYDLPFEFTPTLPYNPAKKYYANDRCIIDFAQWVGGAEYKNLSSCVIHNKIGYICLVDNTDAEFNENNWQSIGNQYDIYHIPLPKPRFNIEPQTLRGAYTAGFYTVGDEVWWENHIYIALRGTIVLSHSDIIQYEDYNDIGYPNVFPNDKNSGHLYWSDEGEYVIAAGDYPYIGVEGNDVQPVWVLGDNRDPVMIQAVIDLALWQLHKRISPMNIPILRENAMIAVFQWLRNVKKDEESVDLEYLQPPQGSDITWGSDPKKINGY